VKILGARMGKSLPLMDTAWSAHKATQQMSPGDTVFQPISHTLLLDMKNAQTRSAKLTEDIRQGQPLDSSAKHGVLSPHMNMTVPQPTTQTLDSRPTIAETQMGQIPSGVTPLIQMRDGDPVYHWNFMKYVKVTCVWVTEDTKVRPALA
jgi:hypothetical protein